MVLWKFLPIRLWRIFSLNIHIVWSVRWYDMLIFHDKNIRNVILQRLQLDLHDCTASRKETFEKKLDKSQNNSQINPENIIQYQDKKTSTFKEFHCNYCTREFKERINLTRHISVVHHNVRPFSCEACKKAFAFNCTFITAQHL